MSKTAEVMYEAAERLKLLGFDWDGEVCQSMARGDLPKCSDNIGICRVRELTDEEWQQVAEFQEQYGKVYHVIHSNFGEIGILDAYLYFPVPLDDEECKRDREDIEEGCPFAYVRNLTWPEFSEFGSIGVKYMYGTLVRTC